MIYKSLIKTIIISGLTIGLCVGAVAQKKSGVSNLTSSTCYQGSETFLGNRDDLSGLMYGNSFVLRGEGEWDSRYLTISINHGTSFHGQFVSGGSWSLAIIDANGYVGTIYGIVTDGEIQSTTNLNGIDSVRIASLRLLATGGEGVFAESQKKPVVSEFELTTNTNTLETTGRGLNEY